MNRKVFKNRAEAGRILAGLLASYEDTPSVVYAMPRGGVVLGKEISSRLNLPLDLVITRKIGHPDNPEYAIGAVSESGEILIHPDNEEVAKGTRFEFEVERERMEAKRRREVYLNGRQRVSAKGKNAIIVDDGVATGMSLRLAIAEIKKDLPWKTIVAVAVIPEDVATIVKGEADELVACTTDHDFLGSVGSYYEDFGEVSDEEVAKLLL